MREYRFRLDRSGVGLRRRRGLLTLTDVTLPIRRVQAAIIGTGPLREAFGWSELKLQSLARDEATKGDHVVAPLADDAEVAAIIGEIGWRPIAPDVRLEPCFGRLCLELRSGHARCLSFRRPSNWRSFR